MAALVPILILVWLALETLFRRRRTPLVATTNAFLVAILVWLFGTRLVDWSSEVPVALWWCIATLTGLFVCYSIWPVARR